MKKATLKQIRELGGFGAVLSTPNDVQRKLIEGFLHINHSSSEIVEAAHQVIKTLSPSIDSDIFILSAVQKKNILSMCELIKDSVDCISREVKANEICL